jgi:hypothetical protein
VQFVAAFFNELVSSFILPSHSHVILHGGHPCPELQNPLLQKAKENLLPGEKMPVRADEGWWKVLF